MHLFYAGFEVVVDQDIIVLVHALCFLFCTLHSAFDDFFCFRSAPPEASFQLLGGRRCDEHKKGVRTFFLDLKCSLDFNLKQNIFSGIQLLLYVCLRRSVGMFYVTRILEEGILFYHAVKLFFCTEKVRYAVFLARTRVSCGDGDGQRIVVVLLHQAFHQCSFSCSGKTGYYSKYSSTHFQIPLALFLFPSRR